MLISEQKFGGIIPKIADPRLVPEGKGQIAKNCRFDKGGMVPLNEDSAAYTPTNAGPIQSIFLYPTENKWFAWDSDVDAVLSPTANDSFKRVYCTEGGVLKATDKDISVDGGTDYPEAYYLPCPPAQTIALEPAPPFGSYQYDTSYNSGDVLYGASPNSGTLFGATVDVSAVSAYDPAKTYKKGEVVSHNSGGADDFYYATNDITVPEAWTVAHWTYIATFGALKFKSKVNSAAFAFFLAESAFQLVDQNVYSSVAYTYTLVNSYGQEGAPATVSSLFPFFADGSNPITLTLPGTLVYDALHKIVSLKIYRLNQDATGNEQYQETMILALYDPTAPYSIGDKVFHPDTDNIYTCSTGIAVPEAWTIAHWTAGVTDSVPNASLGEVLVSSEWDAAPDGIKGIIPLPDATVVGYVGNTLCPSVPGFPHAFPLSYQKTTDRQIMGLGAYGMTVIVLTDGVPYLAAGNTPANFSMESMKEGYGNMSKRGVVDLNGRLTYPSTEGITSIVPSGSDVLTKNLMTPEQWRARYNPSTINAYVWEKKYLGFYDDGDGGAGFLFDPETQDLVDLDFYATAGYRDPASGTLYLVVNGEIVAFCSSETQRDVAFTGKRHSYLKTSFSIIRVLANSYPVDLQVSYPELTDSDGNPSPATVSVTVVSKNPQRIQPILSEACEIKITSAPGPVTAVFLASSMTELPL